MNLVVGKNSLIAKSLKNWLKADFISHKEISSLDSHSYDRLYLLSFPDIYKDKKEYEFKFENELLKLFEGKEVVYFSTSKVYPNLLNCSEETQLEPQNFYAENKIQIENIVRNKTDDFVILRLSNVFSKNKWSKGTFFDTVSSNFKMNNIIDFDVSFDSIRDFISVNSIEYILKQISSKKINGIYNLGSERGITINQILEICFGRKLQNIRKLQTKKIINQTLKIEKLINRFSIPKYKFYNETVSELGKIKI
tara:strand:+ start:904 stop:1659 length:756 start_codon:yes stop_codon:yes gene_type:complete